jgi:hypothetical protein
MSAVEIPLLREETGEERDILRNLVSTFFNGVTELVGAESFRRSQSRKEPYNIEGAGAIRSRII